jgi:hypothetical protein
MNEFKEVTDAARKEGFVVGCIIASVLWWVCG